MRAGAVSIKIYSCRDFVLTCHMNVKNSVYLLNFSGYTIREEDVQAVPADHPLKYKIAGADASRRTSDMRLQRPASRCR